MRLRSWRMIGPVGMVLTGVAWGVRQQWQALPPERREHLARRARAAKEGPSTLSGPERCERRRLASLRAHLRSDAVMNDKHLLKAKGRAKEAVGALTGDRRLKIEGRIDQAKSSIKHALDAVVDALAASAPDTKAKGKGKNKKAKDRTKRQKQKGKKAKQRKKQAE